MGLIDPVALKPPGFEVAVYSIIGLPPSEAGAEKTTVACVLPATAGPIVGAPGTANAIGVTLFDAAEAAPVPIPLVAVTVKV
jgi:hypothetical protein